MPGRKTLQLPQKLTGITVQKVNSAYRNGSKIYI